MQCPGFPSVLTIFTAVLLSTIHYALPGSSEANTGKEEHVIREVIAVGEIESPSELVGMPHYLDEQDLKHDEPIARILSEPNAKSRTVARLSNGHPVKVLKIQKDWLKISWKTDDIHNQGWLKRSFVEKNAIHAHR